MAKRNITTNDQKKCSFEPTISGKQLFVYNKPIFRFFERVFDHPPGNQSRWGTPTIIKNASTNIKNSYIRGFFDTDGVISMKDFKLGFVQKNKESLEFIKNELEMQGISCGSILKDRNIFRFWICAKKSVLRFIKIIGTMHPAKKGKLEKFVYQLNSDQKGTLAGFRTV